MDTIDTLIAFSTTDCIGHTRLKKIRKEFPKIEDFFHLSPGEMAFFLGVFTDRALKELSSMHKRGEIARERCRQKNIRILPIGHPDYPPLLKTIPDPPFILYVRGSLDNETPLTAVIGTRKSTEDAEAVNRWFCSSFVQYGIGVVSGMAYGHDSIAAKAVLAANGYTIGVLGTAIDQIYPSSMSGLYHELLEKGALVSEYPPGTEGSKWRFPRRNRIVSGMARAVFVVQAPEKSGTLITVKTALEQGRDVYAVPGNPMQEEYKGSNKLLQLGAKMAVSPEEIIKELLHEFPYPKKEMFIPAPQQKTPDKPDPSLSEEESSILAAAGNWVQADELLRALNMEASIFNALITMLEIKGCIEQKPGRIYRRIK